MAFSVLSEYNSSAKFTSGTCWQKAFNGGHCAHMANPKIYKESLKKINELHYQLWSVFA
eukprot:CAMPEP_0181297800 /NCGR_PEP_ID=MMETSP1101-20121128/5440_1 /TAXON_ID=46948 /ORGANISM="Rhodomonas abbreviata, Strain Caron Lab Isolate" /LENGTH=58 /DNA_ID=CAMNT_0023402775 /DNA_START=6 /DNA_END=182 /DNA_ORIENTATION=-